MGGKKPLPKERQSHIFKLLKTQNLCSLIFYYYHLTIRGLELLSVNNEIGVCCLLSLIVTMGDCKYQPHVQTEIIDLLAEIKS